MYYLVEHADSVHDLVFMLISFSLFNAVAVGGTPANWKSASSSLATTRGSFTPKQKHLSVLLSFMEWLAACLLEIREAECADPALCT